MNTIGWLSVSGIERDDEGFVLNNDGRRSAVVHQYDRDLELQAWLDARFVHVLDPVHTKWNAGETYSQTVHKILVERN